MSPRRLLAAFWLCGCSADPAPGDSGPAAGGDGLEGSDGGDGTDGDDPPALQQPILQQPVEAEDLDPAEGVVQVSLVAAPATHRLTDWRTGETIEIAGYAYNGSLPGPTLRARLGDRLVVDFENQLDDATTLHWHGLDVPNAMDGSPMTQAPVGPGERFRYEFTLEQAGTFWYHPHIDTEHQVDLGLYGAIVVEDPADPAVDADLLLVFDDWREVAETDAEPSAVHGAHGEVGLWAVNGQVLPRLVVGGGLRYRLRLLDVSNHGYLNLSLPGARVIGHDQGLDAAPAPADAVVLGPGDRAELELLPAEGLLALMDSPYSLNGGAAQGEAEARLDIEVDVAAPAAAPPAWAFSGASPAPDPGRTDVLYVFQGEAHSDSWAINGEQYPDITVQSLSFNQDAVIEVRNLSATEHPFHLHGLVFELLSLNGVAPAFQERLDTLNIPIYGVARLRVVAHNPGMWMAHCHILPHADGGMMSMLQVTESTR